jgi:hypothetical protein
MIQLDQYEKQWILLCKGHLQEKYPFTGEWYNTLKPLFIEIYGWNPDEDNNYKDYLQCIFSKLLDLYLKIKDKWSSENAQLKEIFNSAFYKSFINESELPIERAINKICGLIQCVKVINEDKSERFNLK